MRFENLSLRVKYRKTARGRLFFCPRAAPRRHGREDGDVIKFSRGQGFTGQAGTNIAEVCETYPTTLFPSPEPSNKTAIRLGEGYPRLSMGLSRQEPHRT